MTARPTSEAAIRVGISACLLGEKVRYDGGHKRDSFLVDVLGRYVEWVPVCPEVELGLGTPRKPLKLVKTGESTRFIVAETGEDLTAEMESFSQATVKRLAGEELCGYVFKKDSPSCGLAGVNVYDRNGHATNSGRGLFARSLTQHLPNLPVEEEGSLADPKLRENFIERIFAYARLRALFKDRWSMSDLIEFHRAHKLALLAHSPEAYRGLGRIVAQASSRRRAGVRQHYESEFMRALAVMTTPRRHASVMTHIAASLNDSDTRAELLGLIDDYRRGMLPLIVPLTLLRHHVRRLRGQTYLAPDPREVMLHNHA